MKPTNSKRLQQLVNLLLILVVAGLAGWLSTRYKFEADWTYGSRNTLTEASQKFLGTLKGPVTMMVFDYPNAENRTEIEAVAHRYARFKPDFRLEWVDPGREPARVKKYNVASRGEAVLEYQDRHENLRQLSEATVTGALQRLADAGEYHVVFLEGHGERGTQAEAVAAQTDMTQFAEALAGKGLKVQPLNLVKTPKIPDNTSVLVIASPTKTLLDGEVKLIDDYVQNGGSLLWLTDPELPPGLDPLAKTLGITWQNGFVIFADYAEIGAPSPAIFYATDYPPNAVTQDFRDITAFPLARSVTWEQDPTKRNGWTPVPLVQTNDHAWLESGKLEGGISFDAASGDIAGPLTIGLSLTREHKGADGKAKTQRVVVFGDSDFLSDANLKQYGNEALGLNIMQWLASRDTQLNIDVPKAPDASLRLPGWATLAIGLGFTLALPLLLLGTGITRWMLRRRR